MKINRASDSDDDQTQKSGNLFDAKEIFNSESVGQNSSLIASII